MRVVSIEPTDKLERRMTIEVPKEDVQNKIETRLKSLAKQTRLNGFRPGKIPLRVMQQKFGPQVRQEVLNEVVQTSFDEAVQQQNLTVTGDPTVDFDSGIEDVTQDLTYTVVFQVFHEDIDLHLDGLAIEKPIVEISDQNIDSMLERLQQQRQRWHDVAAVAEVGYRVTLDGSVTIGGERFDEGELKKVNIIAGEPNIVFPGLAEGLVGVKENEDKTIDLTFPGDYPNEILANKTAQFSIHITAVAEPKLPEIDNEFAKSLGVEDGNLETLRQQVRENMGRELKFALKSSYRQRMLNALLEANLITVADSLVAQESERMLKMQQSMMQGLPQAQNMTADFFKDEAKQRIQISVLVQEVVKKHGLQLDQSKVTEMIDNIAYGYERPDDVINWYRNDPQRMKQIESSVLEDEVTEFLMNTAQATEKQEDFFDVMDQAPRNQM